MRLPRMYALAVPSLMAVLLLPTAAHAAAKKPTRVKVPVVAGKRVSAAKHVLQTAGLKATVTRQTSTTVARGRVIGSTPKAGRKVRRGATVTLLASTGRPKPVTYTGSGTIDSLEADADQLDVAFSFANAPLAALIATADREDGDDGDGSVLPLTVGPATVITVSRTDGEPSGDDLGFACVGDEVAVTVVAPGPTDSLGAIPASMVTITSGELSDCGNGVLGDDGDDFADDPGGDLGGDAGDDPGDDPGSGAVEGGVDG